MHLPCPAGWLVLPPPTVYFRLLFRLIELLLISMQETTNCLSLLNICAVLGYLGLFSCHPAAVNTASHCFQHCSASEPALARVALQPRALIFPQDSS